MIPTSFILPTCNIKTSLIGLITAFCFILLLWSGSASDVVKVLIPIVSTAAIDSILVCAFSHHLVEVNHWYKPTLFTCLLFFGAQLTTFVALVWAINNIKPLHLICEIRRLSRILHLFLIQRNFKLSRCNKLWSGVQNHLRWHPFNDPFFRKIPKFHSLWLGSFW